MLVPILTHLLVHFISWEPSSASYPQHTHYEPVYLPAVALEYEGNLGQWEWQELCMYVERERERGGGGEIKIGIGHRLCSLHGEHWVREREGDHL